jgi:hypothetical protein
LPKSAKKRKTLACYLSDPTLRCHGSTWCFFERPEMQRKTLDPDLRRDDVVDDVGHSIVVPAQAGAQCLWNF